MLPKINEKKFMDKMPKLEVDRYHSRVESCRSIISKDKFEKEF